MKKFDWTKVKPELLQAAKDNRTALKFTRPDVVEVIKAASDAGASIVRCNANGEAERERKGNWGITTLGLAYWVDADWQPPVEESAFDEQTIVLRGGHYSFKDGTWVSQFTDRRGYIGMWVERPDGTMDEVNGVRRIHRVVPLYYYDEEKKGWGFCDRLIGDRKDDDSLVLKPGIPKVALFVKEGKS